ncbi:hypothetical protein L249_3677 [Ophiocordyceps polyrhachis-furcata BCC 54312]|uniref:Ubiquitin carrier protein n=1 Tax=Ophiocordyceps polyrhachis-furcata BCC 54312 TaxID=1330021 RepID=A0A367L4L7_9HYPO|nr:hypothetical protein L249_3677 [Ophiocordyceps polyrhachis-furcata BCC 54312]
MPTTMALAVDVSLSLHRRALAVASSTDNLRLPRWTWLVLLLQLIVLVPILLILSYSLETMYPVFAMIEDDDPPSYRPVSLESSSSQDDLPLRLRPKPTRGGRPPRPLSTSSLRDINRLLMAHGGVMANFRGFSCALAQTVATSLLMAVFTAALGGLFAPVATLLASLALVQLSAAWLHIVISRPSPLRFWQRLPPFKPTFEATWRPVTIFWFACEVARWIPLALISITGLTLPELQIAGHRQADIYQLNGVFVVKALALLLVTLAFSVFLVIPANVVLVRVQASLLPAHDETIVSFDRSFQARVEPAVVGGRGYVSMSDAWATFSRRAWHRLLTLYLKVFFVFVAGILLVTSLLLPVAVVIAKNSVPVD